MSKVWITGIAGHLGSSLARCLVERGYEVAGNDIRIKDEVRSLGALEYLGVKYVWKATEDLGPEDLKGVSVVINCGAEPNRPMGISSPVHTIHTNLIPMVRLLEICRRIRVERFVHPGSGTVYAGLPERELPATESTVPRPANPYSFSKYAQDLLCQTYHLCYGVPTVVMRSGMVIGVPMRLDISVAQFIMRALRDEPIVVRSPHATRTPTDISDVLKYWCAVIDTPQEKVVGKVFHTVYPTSPAVKGEWEMVEIARTVREVLRSDSEIVEGEYEPGELVSGRPSREWVVSTTAPELGVRPSVDLKQSIRRIADWIRRDIL